MTRPDPSTNADIKERINTLTSSYTIPQNRLKILLDQAQSSKVSITKPRPLFPPISNRILLAGFLMLWLKRSIVPTLPHEVIVTDVVYSAVLLAYDRNIALLPAMVGSERASGIDPDIL